jgi:hypothetical protein
VRPNVFVLVDEAHRTTGGDLGNLPGRGAAQRDLATSGRVTFNAELLSESAAFRKRVIVEELLHLKVPNHGRMFRALLKAHLGRDMDAQPRRRDR